MSSQNRLLVIDDEVTILELIQNIYREKYDVTITNNGEGVLGLVDKIKPDAMILDLRMPKVDGYMVLETMRNSPTGISMPILVLSALKDVQEKTRAFRMGADDYITKPFHPEELAARIDSKIARFKQLQSMGLNHEIRYGNLSIDLHKKIVRIELNEINLTRLEFEILEKIIIKDGGLVKRDELILQIWGPEPVSDRILDAHISSLRKKMVTSDFQIFTVYGGGFRFKESNSGAANGDI